MKILKQRWRALQRGSPGRRFQDRYAEARKSRADGGWAQRGRRVLRLFVALIAIVIGAVLMFIPGPAVVFYFFAGTLLASESLYLAKLMDWGEVRLRALWKWGNRHWGRMPRWGRVVLVILVVCLSVTSSYVTYRLFKG